MTPRIGLWLDTSDQTAEESAGEIMKRGWPEAVIAAQHRVRPARWLAFARRGRSTQRSATRL